MLKLLRILVLLTIPGFIHLKGFAQPLPTANSAELKLALDRLNVLGSVLYIAAHPDDENTSVLTYLTKERHLRTAYLSLTRGDGGQNLIGSEQGPLLGIIRTQELLAARRIDGAMQLFTRAIDFGYSKSEEETLAIWDKEKILSDIVWLIRTFQPDVIISRFSPESSGGHGHHVASAVLAREAFFAAANPHRFTHHFTHTRPWQAKRLLWNTWRPNLENLAPQQQTLTQIDIGAFNSLLGKSYTEIAADSRSMHKSQGFGAAERRGSRIDYFVPLAGEPAQGDFMSGIDTGWSRITDHDQLAQKILQAQLVFQPEQPAKSLSFLLEAYREVKKIDETPWSRIKKQEIAQAIRDCAGLWLEAISASPMGLRGQELQVTAAAINRSEFPITLDSISHTFPIHSKILVGQALEYNRPMDIKTTLSLPEDMPFTQPYWLRHPPEKGSYVIDNPSLIGLAVAEPPLHVTFHLCFDREPIDFVETVSYRWTDPVQGERYRQVVVGPDVVVDLEQTCYLFTSQKAKPIRVTIKSNAPTAKGALSLRLPSGWRCHPESIPFECKNSGQEQHYLFMVTAPAQPTSGAMQAQVLLNDQPLSHSMQELSYPHIPIQVLFPVAAARLLRLEVQTPAAQLGYIMGSGDDVPATLAQLGYTVKLLTDQELLTDNLSQYNALILGVRALNTRPRLAQLYEKFTQYVSEGGTLVVQYNTASRLAAGQIGPFPFQISNDRVTVEEAPVTLLDPTHPLLHYPNRITAADFDGWIQERGLYFANTWDDRYETILASNDPGESPKSGGLLYLKYGKGVFIYTGYSWFRQLPAGVPGAIRLFVNLFMAGKSRLK